MTKKWELREEIRDARAKAGNYQRLLAQERAKNDDLSRFKSTIATLRDQLVNAGNPVGYTINDLFPDNERYVKTVGPPAPLLNFDLGKQLPPRRCGKPHRFDGSTIYCTEPFGHDKVKHPAGGLYDHADGDDGLWWNDESLRRPRPLEEVILYRRPYINPADGGSMG